MAVLGNIITPGTSNLRHIEAQGAQTGDYAWGSDGNYYRWNGANWDLEQGASAGGGQAPPPFKFDFEAEEQKAFEKLRPYYEQKLAESGGDVELAKARIDEDYTRGLRISGEEYGRGERIRGEEFARGERIRGEELGTQMAQLGQEFEPRRREMLASANIRGTLLGEIPTEQQTSRAPYSDYAEQYLLGPLSKEEKLRRQVLERAIQRQAEVAGLEKTRGGEEALLAKQRFAEEKGIERGRDVEDIQTKFDRYKKALEQEKREEAIFKYVPLAQERAYQKYQQTV